MTMTQDKPLQSEQQPAPIPPSRWRPPPSSLLSIALAIGLASGGTLAILAAWRLPPFSTAVVSTENAYVRGRTTVISPQVSGYISAIGARDYENVTASQELLKIDDGVYRQQVAQAQANLDIATSNLANNRQVVAQRRFDIATAEARIAGARAQLAKATADFDRATNLVASGSNSVSQRDTAQAAELSMKAGVQEALAGRDSALQALRSAEVNEQALKSQVESAKAQLELARINLGYTIVRSPEAGQLSDVGARLGQYVTSGSQLLFLVPEARWVVANFKETQTTDIQPGQRAWFRVDALRGAKFAGKVERISPAAGSEFSVLRTDNAIGNFTKIPQRISVRITIDDNQPGIEKLRPGMSVEVDVDTSAVPRKTTGGSASAVSPDDDN